MLWRPTSARADKSPPKGHNNPPEDDAEAIKIGEAYKTLVELKKIEAKATGDVELREVEIGGMLIDVRLVHKRKFGKWLDDNAALLGFRRAHAYNLISSAMVRRCALHPTRQYFDEGDDFDFRSKAVDRAQKWRDKNKEKLDRLQAFEDAERAEREAKRRDKAKAEREALGPSRFDKETILGDGTVVPTPEPKTELEKTASKQYKWRAKANHLMTWLGNAPGTISAHEFAPEYVEALIIFSETMRTTAAHLTRLAEAIEAEWHRQMGPDDDSVTPTGGSNEESNKT